MRKILSCAAVAAMLALAWGANGADTPPKKAPAKKSAAHTSAPAKKGAGTATAHKPGTTAKSAATHGKKPVPAKRVSWRNRQASPSPDRYREIQGALAAKGFLKPEDATGTWNQTSSDALKKFQTEQNLESSGKINSLSLIALGLGPHRDPAPPPKNPQPPPPGQ
jgi:hypothetical protein